MPYQEVGLSENEYHAIIERIGRKPTESELKLFGVMWSEHCSYKSTRHLLKHFPNQGKYVLGGIGENAGLVSLDEDYALAFKIESHNHPCAVDPYQGAATGVGGIIRDILAVGAYPIAMMDALFFGDNESAFTKQVKEGVVAGVGGYGNCVGVPTVGGKTFHSSCYEENPLLNAFCLGIVRRDKIASSITGKPGQILIVLGSPTGKDGIAGAAFASVEFDEDKESKRPNIQIGDPFSEKKLIECTHELLDKKLIACMQDMGAAGVISSTSEVAAKSKVGMKIHLDKTHVRTEGMTGWEIALSETQERMLLLVEPDLVDEVKATAKKWQVEMSVIGETTADGNYAMFENNELMADLPPEFIGGDAPIIDWASEIPANQQELFAEPKLNEPADLAVTLRSMLSSKNLASKHRIWETYDSMVQLRTVSPAYSPVAVIRPTPSQGLIGLVMVADPNKCFTDPKRGAAEITARCVRDLAVCGAEVMAMTNCLNFASPEKPQQFYELEQCVLGISQAAKALSAPIISGNVSLYNEGIKSRILPTPVLVAVGRISDDKDRLSSGTAQSNDKIYLVGNKEGALGSSTYQVLESGKPQGRTAQFDADSEQSFISNALAIARSGYASSGRGIAGGGLLNAVTMESIISNVGFELSCPQNINRLNFMFGEGGPRAIYSVPPSTEEQFLNVWKDNCVCLGTYGGHSLKVKDWLDIPLNETREIWLNSQSTTQNKN